MRFVVEGIGKIGRAEILLDGITLIVGENNTGKSTIGKALFAHVNSVCGFSRRMKATYRNELSHILFYHAIMEYRDIIGFVHDLIDEMIDVLPGKELNPSSLARWIKHLVDGGGMSADDYETERVEKYLKWLSGRSRQAISFRGQICKLFGIERDQWEQMTPVASAISAVFQHYTPLRSTLGHSDQNGVIPPFSLRSPPHPARSSPPDCPRMRYGQWHPPRRPDGPATGRRRHPK